MPVFNAATTAELTAAYNSASAGDTINLTGTNYAVNGEYTSPAGTKAVTIQGQGAATTKFGFLIIHGSNTTWKDFACQSLTGEPYWNLPSAGTTGVTIQNVDINQNYRTSTNASNWLLPEPYIAVLSLESNCPGWSFDNCQIGGGINAKGCQLVANNTTFTGCTFHDVYLNNQGRTADGDLVHLEGMQAVGVSGLTLRRCTFVRCNVMAIMFTNYGSNPATSNITIENCVFAHPLIASSLADATNNDVWHPSPAVYIANLAPGSFGSLTNWTVRNNTFETAVFCPTRPVTNSKWVGNVGSWPNLPDMTYRYNVGTKIHATDTLVSPAASTKGSPAPFGWVNSASPAYDFHLTAGSVARSKGSPTDHPATDRDGNARNATPDAGAYEYGTAAAVDVLHSTVLADLDAWNVWLDANAVEGVVGEFGFPGNNPEYWPGDADLWRVLGEAYYDRMQTHDIWSLQWGTSESFAAYELAPYTGPSGVLTTDRPQSVPLENHLADAGVRRGVALTGLEFGDWVAGFSNAQPGTLGQNGYVANSQASWNYLAAQGIDFARIGFRWERLCAFPGQPLNSAYLTHIQTQVTRAANAGIDVVLDLHNFGEYHLQTGATVTVARLGSAQLPTSHFADVWSRISAVFASSATVVGYGLMNEPHDVVGGDAAWETMSQAAFDAVRANDATTEVYVAGHNWGKVQDWTTHHPDKWIVGTNVRYEAHHYWDTAPSSIIGAEDSVYGQTYDSAVADLSPTVYIRSPRPSEQMSVSPVTVGGVRDTAGSTTVTVRVYPAGSSTATHTQAVVTSAREWSLGLSTDLAVGDWEATATQGSVVSPRRAFEQLSLAVDHLGISRGPTGSHWGPDADLGTGEWTRSEDSRGTYVDDAFAVAADFYDASSGINHHFPYMTSAQVAPAILRMQEMGIRHIRMGLSSPAIDTRTDYNLKTAQAAQQIRTANANRASGIQNISILAGASGPPAYKQDADNDNPRAFWTCTTTNGNYLYPLDLPSGAINVPNLPGQPPGNPGANNPSGGWTGTYHPIGWTDIAAFQGPNEPPDYFAGYTSPGSMRDEYRMLRDAKNARTTKTVLGGVEYVDFRTGRIATGAFAPQVAVFGFGGLQSGAASYNAFGDYTDGNDQDFGASHEYWGGHLPGFSQQWGRWGTSGGDHWSQLNSYNGAAPGGPGRWAKTLPLVCTETGYYTTVGAGTGAGQNCDQDIASEYLVRTMVHHYLGGFKRTYWFMLSDEASNQPQMGVTDANFIPKAPYWAFKNLLGMVGFREPSTPTPITLPTTGFVPGPTNKIVGQPQYDTQFPDELHKLIVQTADSPAREYLAFYSRQRTIWQRVQGVRVNVADPQTVTIQLPPGSWTVEVAEPAKNPIRSPVDGQTYSNPTNGSLFSTVGMASRDVLVPDSNNQIRLGVAGLTRVLKLTAGAGLPLPVVTVTDPTPAETVEDVTPTITGTASSAVGDSANVVVTTYAGSTATGSPVLGPTNVARVGTAWSHTLGTLAEGIYTVRVTQAGTSGTSVPVDRTFSVLAPIDPPPVPLPPPIRVTVREKPRTDLHMLVTTPNGKKYRWSDSDKRPQYAPSDLRFSTSMPGGFETQECVLPRKPNVDYQDLKRLTDIDVRAPGGAQVWEGRLERAPKSSGDRIAVSPSAVGYQAELEDDRAARFLGIDRNLESWGPMSTQRWLDMDGTSVLPGPYTIFDPELTRDEIQNIGGLKLGLTPPWRTVQSEVEIHAPRTPLVEGWYDAKGLEIAALYYSWKNHLISGSDPDWTWQAFLSSDAVVSAADGSGNLREVGPGQGVVGATAPRKFALVQLYNTDSVSQFFSMLEFRVWFTALAVIGAHGIPPQTQGALPEGQFGLFASDIVRHVVPKFAPRLKVTADSVEASNFIIDQFAYLEPTTVAEIVKQASRFELQDWAVWGNRTFYWNRRGSRGRHWRARLRPSQLQETGPTLDRLWNEIVVRYQDVSGVSRTVGPPGSGCDTESPLLKDNDPENPANQIGKTRRDVLEMGTSGAPSGVDGLPSPRAAIEIGYRFLQETKALDSSGDATLVGHVRDDKGVLYPASRVRAGDDITFIDASSKVARRIIKTEYTHSNRSTQVSLDAPAEGLAALLDRMAVRLSPHGFG